MSAAGDPPSAPPARKGGAHPEYEPDGGPHHHGKPSRGRGRDAAK